MSYSFRSILLTVVGIVLFIALLLAANSVGFFGDALTPFIGPVVQGTSLTSDTGAAGRSGTTGSSASATRPTGGSAVGATPTVRR